MTEQSRRVGGQSRCKSVIWVVVLVMGYFARMNVSAAVDLVLAGTDSPDPVITLSNLTYTLTFTNIGSTTATNVTVTNFLSTRVTFISATNTRGSCTNVSGVIRCDSGNLAAGVGGRITIVARPSAPGVITNVASCAASQTDANPSNNVVTLITSAVNRRTFSSTDFIEVTDVTPNAAIPYPSTIIVAGLTTAVHKVTCTLNNVTHGAPDDLDILLVGPDGGYVMLLSDGPITPGMADVTLTFDDAAPQFVPDTNAITSGIYKPANYGSIADILPPPAPNAAHLAGFTPMSVFNGINPNGNWRLFVYDDESEVGGWVDGWSLTILTMEPMANLAIGLTDSPDPALPGATVTYTAKITNMGPVSATGVKFTNQVPPGLAVVTFSSTSGSCTNDAGTVRCDLGPIPVGSSEQVIIQARPANGGNYSNRVEVASDQFDPQPADNIAVQATLVNPRVDVGVDVNSSRTPALLEQPLIYTLAVTNLGPDPATGVRLVDQLPPGVLLVNLSASQGSCTNQSGLVTCNLGTVSSQGRATVFLTCRPTALGSITNTATISADQVDANASNNTAQNINTVDPAADLLLTITDAPDPVPVLQPFAYSIVVSNRGPNVASNIVVADLLPATLRLVSLQTTRGACTNDGNSLTCTVPDLPVADRLVMTVTVTATTLGTVVNTAFVAAQPIDPNPVNNSATATTLVLPATDISVTKASDRPIVWEGDRITYSFLVSNSGPSLATGARLSDPLPPGMTFNSAVASVGTCALQGGVVTCSFGDLASGGAVIVTIVGTPTLSGNVTNSVNASANEQDVNLSNNNASALTTVIPKTLSQSDTTPVILPDVGVAPTYPLAINVSGMTAAVQRVRVTLGAVSHSYPDDLDILLVGPGGQTVVVMSDSGGSTGITNANLTLDDLAPATVPDSTALSSLLYRPADYEPSNSEFPTPAPAGPYGTSFDVFTGTDPNGTWKLYVLDDQAKDQGVFANGWKLDIWARDPLADLAVNSSVAPELVAVGSNVMFRVAVSNKGPATATAVILTNAYGPNLTFLTAPVNQGACTNEAGLVVCALGDLSVQSSTFVDLVFTVNASGTISNIFGVTASSIDLAKGDNVSAAAFLAEDPPVIVAPPRNRFVPLGSTATFTVVANGAPPLSYQWFFQGVAIPGATSSNLVVGDVQPQKLGEYQVGVNNRVGSALSHVVQLGTPRPPVVDAIPDQLMDEDGVLTVPLVIAGADDPFETFLFSAVCADTNLVPSTNLTFTLTGTNYTLVVRPGTNQFGTNLITVTVTNSAGLSASRAFVLGVQSVNDYPYFIVPVGNQTMLEGGLIDVPFVIGDVETPATLLITAARIYNPAMIVGIALFGADSNRVIRFEGIGETHGTTLVELRLRDEAGVRTTNFFNLTIVSVNDPPTISAINDATIWEDSPLSILFFASDPESATDELFFSAESSNQALFRNDAFSFDAAGTSPILNAVPVQNSFGTSRITVFVRDGAGLVASNAFWITVNPVNDLPFVSQIPTVEVLMNQTSAPISLIIGDPESSPDALTIVVISTNAVLMPTNGIQFSGSGSNRTLSITPATGQTGWTVLRMQVRDPEGALASRDFELFVHPTNGPPEIVQQPISQTAAPGATVALSVIAIGHGGLSYLWQRDGQDLPDRTNSTIAIAAAVGADRGEYRVRVTNPEGTTISAPAQLNVLEGTRILRVRRVGSTTEVTFGTIAKQRYTVEFQNAIGSDWTPLPQVIGTGLPMTVMDSAPTVPTRFYRVRVE